MPYESFARSKIPTIILDGRTLTNVTKAITKRKDRHKNHVLVGDEL